MTKNSYEAEAATNLPLRQAAFIREYLIDLNATQAAIRAGYSEKTAQEQGSRLLSKVMVQEAIERAMDERSERTAITQDFVLRGIQQCVERCMQAEPVKGKDGEPTGEYRFEAMAALKGYELLGKHLKLFTERVENTGPDGIPLMPPVLNVTFVKPGES